MAFDDSVKLIWSLTASGLATGTTIAAAGNSGGWVAYPVNARTPVDLRRADDIWLSVFAAGVTGTTPSLTVTLNGYDDLGNLFPLLAVPALSAAGAAGAKIAFGGRHGGGGAGSYFVPGEWGAVAWTVSGTTPSFTGVEIALYAR